MNWLLMAAGAFSIIGSTLDLPFFMGNRKAQALVSLIGHGPTRLFYLVLGAFIFGIGLALQMGWIENNST